MTDIKIVSPTHIVFQKKLWHETEILLAKCFNFTIDIDTGVIVCDITFTSKKALFEFIRISFKNFSDSLAEEKRRNDFYGAAEEMYRTLEGHSMENIMLRLPYFDELYAHQVDTLKESFYKQFNFLALDMGLGKANPLHTNVLTPNGYKTMGEICIGDDVISSNGRPCKVTGVFPQGVKEYFRVHFSDGTHAECCDDHLWICRQINLHKKWDWRVKPLKDLKNDLIYKTKERDLFKWKIPRTQPVWFNESAKHLKPIHPYLLGVLLGDGCIVTTASISTDDADELIPLIRPMLPDGMVIKKQKGKNYSWNIVPEKRKGGEGNELLNQLRLLDLFDKRSHEKFVPAQYLYTTVNEREQLLQGLLDTDGHISIKNSRISMTTTSPMIKDAVIFLVQSLGGIATFGEDKREDTRLCYYVNINLPDVITPFKLTRRLNRLKKKERHLARKIVKVESMGFTECQCISVDSPDHSYLIDNFIVTHNTLISASISRIHRIPLTVIVCPAAVKWNWFRDLTDWGFNELYFTILDSTKRRTIRAFNERFIIINYDMLGAFSKELIARGVIGHFILDEAHMLKNHLSARYKQLKGIIDHFPDARITFLSGTPVKNRVNDVFAYLKLVNHELGSSNKKFLDEYTVKTGSRGGDRVTGGKNLQDLYVKLSNFMIRKTKEECLDLPDKIFLSYRFELEDYRTEYNKVIEELSQQKDITSLTGNIHSLNIITFKAKIPGIKELAETIIEQGKKVVIFGGYRDPLNELEKYFGKRCVKIDGSVDAWTRDQHVQRFHNDPECVVFIGNMQAAGVGINLTNASDVIFGNFPLTPAELYQAIDRLNRIGQKNCVNVHYTFCDDSIDEYIYEIIVDKEKDINALIDQGKEVMYRENTTEILIKKLLKKDNIDNYEKHMISDSPGVHITDPDPDKHPSEILPLSHDKPMISNGKGIMHQIYDDAGDERLMTKEQKKEMIYAYESLKNSIHIDPCSPTTPIIFGTEGGTSNPDYFGDPNANINQNQGFDDLPDFS